MNSLGVACILLERIKPTCIAGSGAAKVSSRARRRPMLVERSPTPEPTFPGLPHRRSSYLGCGLASARVAAAIGTWGEAVAAAEVERKP
jgi:hypothetical protein